MTKKRWIVIAAFVLVAGVAIWFAVSGQKTDNQETLDLLNGRERLILLDGKEMTGAVISPGEGNDLWVSVQLNGEMLLLLPFGEEHTLEVIQQTGRNKIRMAPEKVYMEEADCPGHDCVESGSINRGNWEIRAPITCLPHKLVVYATDDIRYLERDGI